MTNEGGDGSPLDWNEIPLLKYESEIFVKTGAWTSLYELENNLTLDEMFLLYRACNNEVNMNMKLMAASQGADVDFSDDWYDPAPPDVLTASDLRGMPIGLMIEEI